jgi:T-complex protein 1 subunit eta
MTTLRSKLVSDAREFFADMIVDAVDNLDDDLRLEARGVKLVKGGGIQDSFFVPGIAFKRTFFYAGFDQQPKHFTKPKILLLNVELELQGASTDSEVRVDKPEEFQGIVDAEWNLIQRKLVECRDSGANIVLSKKAIGDIATQFFADHNIFCAGRVPEADLKRTAKATGGTVLSTTSGITPASLGTAAVFEERQVGSKRFNVFTGCRGKAATIVLRGGAKQFLEEAERSIHDAIMIVRRAKKAGKVVGGAGAVEMTLARALTEKALKLDGKSQLIVQAYATALETIPTALANNAGFDSFEILNKLRAAHAKEGGTWIGVDIEKGDVVDALKEFIWEPLVVKLNALKAATEAACTILAVDETIAIPEHDHTFDTGLPGRGGPVRGRGAPGPGLAPTPGLPGLR